MPCFCFISTWNLRALCPFSIFFIALTCRHLHGSQGRSRFREVASTEWTGLWALKPFSQTWPASRVWKVRSFFPLKRSGKSQWLNHYTYYTKTVYMTYLYIVFFSPSLPLYTVLWEVTRSTWWCSMPKRVCVLPCKWIGMTSYTVA